MSRENCGDELCGWAPLENAVGNALAGEFMLMGDEFAADGELIRLFKHVDTRRYLNLSVKRSMRAYVYEGGSYHPVDTEAAVAWAFEAIDVKPLPLGDAP